MYKFVFLIIILFSIQLKSEEFQSTFGFTIDFPDKYLSLGISDSSNLSGALEFAETISKSGTQPIIGTQINFKIDNEIGLLPLIAKNLEGYKSIVELSSKPFLNQQNQLEEPSIELDELLEKNGIIVLSGSISGLFGKLFVKDKISIIEKNYKKLKNKFNDDFYLEIQRHNDLNEKQFEELNLNFSQKFDIPIISKSALPFESAPIITFRYNLSRIFFASVYS